MPSARLVALLLSIAAPATALAAATDAPSATSTTGPAAPLARHALYVELLGKAGLWGVGYDYQLTTRWGVGGVASYSVLHGQRIAAVAPYVALYPFGRAEEVARNRHRGFIQAGPQLFVASTPSTVPEWPGRTSAGVGGEVSIGYEYRSRVLLRAYAMGTVGQNGFAPWTGLSIGWLK